MTYFGNIREEELKLKVGEAFFSGYDRTAILGNVDFCIAAKSTDSNQLGFDFDRESFLWAESKRGAVDLLDAFTQLVLTIGRARTFDHYLPPSFLGAFDADKIGFVPYSAVIDVFYQNDFNWNVTPSDHSTKEFKQVRELIEKTVTRGSYIYHYATDAAELVKFIKANFKSNKQNVSCIRVTKNNFVNIYLKWRAAVMPTIAIDWDAAKKTGILDADFYLADLLSEHDLTLKDKLNVVLRKTKYELNRKIDALGLFNASNADFNDEQREHIEFWNRYIRPPKREYWDYIIERRDLLIPQDVRERNGSFFTPAIWVAKAQEYLATALGENWQDEYYIWDCCAGTGNLLTGLVNKYNIWASTLDKSDVDVMLDRIANGANLLPTHVFQFDFLNGDFNNLPQGLRDIIGDSEKRKKLVVFINPPYAEHGNAKQKTHKKAGLNKSNVAKETAVYKLSKTIIGSGARELFVQFLYRIYIEIPNCTIGNFSTLKPLTAQNFNKFRQIFQAKLCRLFVVPSYTFDNVSGSFPIGFFVWDTKYKEVFVETYADVFNEHDTFIGRKFIQRSDRLCIKWIKQYYDKNSLRLAFFRADGSDTQHNNGVFLTLRLSKNDEIQHFYMIITAENIIPFSIYFTIRHCLTSTWLNHNDQYYWPNDGWKSDNDFQTDCLAYTIFAGKNNIKSSDGVNHWIPFPEAEVGARDRYSSHFLLDYMAGRWRPKPPEGKEAGDLFDGGGQGVGNPLTFTPEARAVFDAARELWRYYHAREDSDHNAGFYDIREYFQGRNDQGVMNPDSNDAEYMRLLDEFKQAYKSLAANIEPKIYRYGFLQK